MSNKTCSNILVKDLCWRAGIDEEVVINYKYLDENGVKQPTNITGYSGILEVRVKAYDAAPVLSVAATLVELEGKFIWNITDTETQALLVSQRRDNYVYRTIVVDPDTLRTIITEGTLEVSA